MTPQEVAALAAIVAMVQEIGAWPLLTLVVMTQIGPWIGMLIITYIQGKRHAQVVKMYEDNVTLCKSNENMAKGFQEVVVLATQTMSKVQTSVDANLFCPMMRKEQKIETRLTHGS